jgi:hypothetical protein
MTAVLRDPGIQTVHDQIVSEVAQRWAKAFQCKVTIKTEPEQNLWADAKQQADIVGWFFSPRGNSIEWVAEVETEQSLSDSHTGLKWRQAAVPGIPLYLLIPRGMRRSAEKLASCANIHFTGIYEYAFVNGIVQIL